MNLSILDRIRLKDGTDKFKYDFREMGQQQREKAIELINEEGLLHATLFVLIPEIDFLNLYGSLNSRNHMALQLIAKILMDKKMESKVGAILAENSQEVVSTLRWMLNTGAIDDGLNDKFDKVLDCTAALLIRQHNDKSVLQVIAKIIFKRNRNGHFIHDLVWTFFKAHEPNSLNFIADYIQSPKQKDAELACMLLNLNMSADKQKQYDSYIAWLSENDSFLYFTDQNFQSTSHPDPCGVHLEGKYLNKSISLQNGKMLEPLSENEQICSNGFNESDQRVKIILSKYSKKLHDHDLNLWSKWLQFPTSKQLIVANNGLGGLQ